MPVLLIAAAGIVLLALLNRGAGATVDAQVVTSDADNLNVKPVASAHKGNAVSPYARVSGAGPQPFSRATGGQGRVTGGGLQALVDGIIASFSGGFAGIGDVIGGNGQTRFGNDQPGTKGYVPTVGGGTSGDDGGTVGTVGGVNVSGGVVTIGGALVPGIATPLAPYSGGSALDGSTYSVGGGGGVFSTGAEARLVQKD